MTKITTIGLTSPCGGNGCTTLAVHLAWFAAQRRGIRTLAVSMDRTGALVRHFLPDQGLRVDSIGRISPTLTACYFDVEATVSKLLPTLGLSKDEYPSLIVVDLGCGMSSDLLTDVGLWLTPVADVRTMRALLDTGYPRSGHATTYISFNRSGGSQYAKRLLADAGDRCNDLSILRAEIPHSGAISRASHRYETVWQHSHASRAAASLKTWADEVLHLAMPKWQADESRQPKVPGAGLSADELLRMDQNLLKVSARKIEMVRDEMLCPVCKKTSLSGRQQICSSKCRSTSYRARLRGSADPIPGVSRIEMGRHIHPMDDRSVCKGYPAPVTPVTLSPEADERAESAYPTPMDQESVFARQKNPIFIQQEVIPPISEVIPTTALSLRSTPTPQTEARQVKPRKSFRPFSRFSDLQERIDVANAKLEAASPAHRKTVPSQASLSARPSTTPHQERSIVTWNASNQPPKSPHKISSAGLTVIEIVSVAWKRGAYLCQKN